MHSGHPRARGCWWAQLGSFRRAEQQELGCCEIWGCQRPRFSLVSSPSPSTGQVWWPLGTLLQPLHTVPVEQCSHCSWLGNGPNIAPAPWAGRRAHSSTRSLPCLPKAPHSPHTPSPTQTPTHTPSPSPSTPWPQPRLSWDHVSLVSCNPALPSPPPSTVMDAVLSAHPPFLLPPQPPGCAPGQHQAGSRAHFPRASAAGSRTWAHTSLPAAPAAPAPPPAADKAQPNKATTSLAAPRAAKPLCSPKGSPAGTRSL